MVVLNTLLGRVEQVFVVGAAAGRRCCVRRPNRHIEMATGSIGGDALVGQFCTELAPVREKICANWLGTVRIKLL